MLISIQNKQPGPEHPLLPPPPNTIMNKAVYRLSLFEPTSCFLLYVGTDQGDQIPGNGKEPFSVSIADG